MNEGVTGTLAHILTRTLLNASDVAFPGMDPLYVPIIGMKSDTRWYF